jgi:hypothetical protein
MAHDLEARIQDIVSRAADEIARTVRASIAEEVLRVVGTRPNSHVPAKAGRGGELPAASGRARGRRGRGAGRQGVSEADVRTVLDYIRRTPGKRSEEIRAALHLSPEVGSKILAKLREALDHVLSRGLTGRSARRRARHARRVRHDRWRPAPSARASP